MADVKNIPLQKRRAMGENVDGMRKGGAVRQMSQSKQFSKQAGHKSSKKGTKC